MDRRDRYADAPAGLERVDDLAVDEVDDFHDIVEHVLHDGQVNVHRPLRQRVEVAAHGLELVDDLRAGDLEEVQHLGAGGPGRGLDGEVGRVGQVGPPQLHVGVEQRDAGRLVVAEDGRRGEGAVEDHVVRPAGVALDVHGDERAEVVGGELVNPDGVVFRVGARVAQEEVDVGARVDRERGLLKVDAEEPQPPAAGHVAADLKLAQAHGGVAVAAGQDEEPVGVDAEAHVQVDQRLDFDVPEQFDARRAPQHVGGDVEECLAVQVLADADVEEDVGVAVGVGRGVGGRVERDVVGVVVQRLESRFDGSGVGVEAVGRDLGEIKPTGVFFDQPAQDGHQVVAFALRCKLLAVFLACLFRFGRGRHFGGELLVAGPHS